MGESTKGVDRKVELEVGEEYVWESRSRVLRRSKRGKTGCIKDSGLRRRDWT